MNLPIENFSVRSEWYPLNSLLTIVVFQNFSKSFPLSGLGK
jgi:hypothetical protein